MTLHLICDVSGSMSEGGKPFIMRTLVTSIAQWILYDYVHAKVNLWAWGAEVQRIPGWSPGCEFPVEFFSCAGTTNSSSLIQSLGSTFEGKVLLLTDGFWPPDDKRILKRWKNSLPSDTLRIIKIGADADPQLKGSEIFSPDDLFAALDGWFQKA